VLERRTSTKRAAEAAQTDIRKVSPSFAIWYDLSPITSSEWTRALRRPPFVVPQELHEVGRSLSHVDTAMRAIKRDLQANDTLLSNVRSELEKARQQTAEQQRDAQRIQSL